MVKCVNEGYFFYTCSDDYIFKSKFALTFTILWICFNIEVLNLDLFQ
jgi:hypothetical protein